jgi:transcriptional regulator with XRE-family HTH domain
MTHKEILENILFKQKISQRELARRIGYSEQNTTLHFGKDYYTQKMIEKIAKALEVDPLIFFAYQEGGTNNTIHQIQEKEGSRIEELKISYEKQLADKDKIIALLERRILELEK